MCAKCVQISTLGVPYNEHHCVKYVCIKQFVGRNDRHRLKISLLSAGKLFLPIRYLFCAKPWRFKCLNVGRNVINIPKYLCKPINIKF